MSVWVGGSTDFRGEDISGEVSAQTEDRLHILDMMALTLIQQFFLVTLLITVPVLGHWAFHRVRQNLVHGRRVAVHDHLVEPVISDRSHSIEQREQWWDYRCIYCGERHPSTADFDTKCMSATDRNQ